MTEQRLRDILMGIKEISVGIIGDFCLDAHWEFDTSHPETSIETGKLTSAVVKQQYSLGGAGNIAANAAAFGVRSVHAFGVIGNDLFGREMIRLFNLEKIATEGILVQQMSFETPVYAKPFINNEEQGRIDFGRFNSISNDTLDSLANTLRKALPNLNALIVNQQLIAGVCSEKMIHFLNDLAIRFPKKIMIVDSRHRANLFLNMIRKLNTAEALRDLPSVADTEAALRSRASEIVATTHRPTFITRGSDGILACDGVAVFDVPAVKLSCEVDTVGAGDTTVAAIACSLAAGASVLEAAEVGNLAAAVTVQKLRQTGTASPEEIIGMFLRHSR